MGCADLLVLSALMGQAKATAILRTAFILLLVLNVIPLGLLFANLQPTDTRLYTREQQWRVGALIFAAGTLIQIFQFHRWLLHRARKRSHEGTRNFNRGRNQKIIDAHKGLWLSPKRKPPHSCRVCQETVSTIVGGTRAVCGISAYRPWGWLLDLKGLPEGE